MPEPLTGPSTYDEAFAHALEPSLVEDSILVDAKSETVAPLRELWEELIAGASKAVASFHTADRCFVVLSGASNRAQPEPQKPPRVPWRNVEILRRVLLGEAQKVIAMDLKMSTSSVSTVASQVLRAMGLHCPPTRVPVMLVMAAYYREDKKDSLTARWSTVVAEHQRYTVVSVPRPDPTQIIALSGAEQQVVGLLVERRSNAEIARLRATSPRTVANQLSRLIQKLRVDGRCGIVNWLVCTSVGYRALPPAFPHTSVSHAIETDQNHNGNVSNRPQRPELSV